MAQAMGTQHADQRISASFDLPQSIIDTNAAELAQCFTTDVPFLERTTFVYANSDQFIFANAKTETFELVSFPKFYPVTLPSGAVVLSYIGSLGDDMGLGAIPVTMTADFFAEQS